MRAGGPSTTCPEQDCDYPAGSKCAMSDCPGRSFKIAEVAPLPAQPWGGHQHDPAPVSLLGDSSGARPFIHHGEHV